MKPLYENENVKIATNGDGTGFYVMVRDREYHDTERWVLASLSGEEQLRLLDAIIHEYGDDL